MAANQTNHRRKYALITGGTSGIGYELAKLFAQDNYNLVLVARSNERLSEVCAEMREMGVEAIPLYKDLFEPDAAQEIYRELNARNVQVEVLVNDAGQGERGMFHEVPLERHLDIVQLNVASLVCLTRLFIEDMVKRKEGKILNLASILSKTPDPEMAVYAASKAFVLSFSEALSIEMENTGVTVTALVPGRTDTDFFYKAHMQETKEYQDHHLADPAQVAKDGYDALMSGKSRIISGIQNKMMAGMLNTMPDSANAANMQKNLRPTEKPERKRRHSSSHAASIKERKDIGNIAGDREEGMMNDER